MSSGFFVESQPDEDWLRVSCGTVVLHECKKSEAMRFEGNNYYPYQSRQKAELFSPSTLQWDSPAAGRAAFSHMTKPGTSDLVRDVMWTHTDPSPGFEFLALYVGYDQNKTFVSRFTPATGSSPSTSTDPANKGFLVDGTSETPPSSSESDSERRTLGRRSSEREVRV